VLPSSLLVSKERGRRRNVTKRKRERENGCEGGHESLQIGRASGPAMPFVDNR